MLVWNELIEFMGEMQRRLEEKEADPDKASKSWKIMSLPELETELCRQVIQIIYAMRRCDRRLIRKKVVDTANYCMMIHDKLGR
jgi:hypothetical protein